jgi:hypothetical protein
MKLEEDCNKCDKCINKKTSHSRDESEKQNSRDNAVEVSINLAIAKCIECEQNMCANCLLEHQRQAENWNHKLATIPTAASPYTSLVDAGQLAQSMMLFKELNGMNSVSGEQSGAKLNESMKTSFNMMLNASQNATVNTTASDDDNSILSNVERKRDCHQVEFLAEQYHLKVDDQESIIKRRHSNLDCSELESKLAVSGINNKLEEDENTNNLSTGDDDNKSMIVPEATEMLAQFEVAKLNEKQLNKLQVQFLQQQQFFKIKQQEQQQQQQSSVSSSSANLTDNRLAQIETEISKTFNFYIQVLQGNTL